MSLTQDLTRLSGRSSRSNGGLNENVTYISVKER